MSVLGKIQALTNETRFEIVKLVRGREMAASPARILRTPEHCRAKELDLRARQTRGRA